MILIKKKYIENKILIMPILKKIKIYKNLIYKAK